MTENTARAIQPANVTAIDLVDEKRAADMGQRIMALFPKDANKQQALDVARIALAYSLDPFLGELIPYQGRPYITIDGRVRIADRHPEFDGYDLEPPTETELMALRPATNESIWKCAVYRKDRNRPTVAYGRAGGPQDRNPISRTDAVTMAQKRAIHRALRAAFPVPIPGLEERLTPEQLRAIHAYDNDLGVSDDERHETLTDTFGVESSRELTAAQASAYLDQRATEASDVLEVPGGVVDDDPEGFRDEDAPLSLDEQLQRDMTRCKALADAATNGAELKKAWDVTVSLFGADEPELRAHFAARRQALRPAPEVSVGK